MSQIIYKSEEGGWTHELILWEDGLVSEVHFYDEPPTNVKWPPR